MAPLLVIQLADVKRSSFLLTRFHEERDADDAMKALDGFQIDGRDIRIQKAKYARPAAGGGRIDRDRSRSRDREPRRDHDYRRDDDRLAYPNISHSLTKSYLCVRTKFLWDRDYRKCPRKIRSLVDLMVFFFSRRRYSPDPRDRRRSLSRDRRRPSPRDRDRSPARRYGRRD